jgi:hypothetical protein
MYLARCEDLDVRAANVDNEDAHPGSVSVAPVGPVGKSERDGDADSGHRNRIDVDLGAPIHLAAF